MKYHIQSHQEVLEELIEKFILTRETIHLSKSKVYIEMLCKDYGKNIINDKVSIEKEILDNTIYVTLFYKEKKVCYYSYKLSLCGVLYEE